MRVWKAGAKIFNLVKVSNDFPINAKKYVAKMVSSTIQVAYPRGYSSKILPRIKFIGVGPDPKQIIRDIPATKILIEELLEEIYS